MYLIGSQEALLGAAEQELSQLSPSLPDAWGGSQKPLCSHHPQGDSNCSFRRPEEPMKHNLVLIKELTGIYGVPKTKKQKTRSLEPRENKITAARSDAHSTS